MRIRLGTRGSALALAQTRRVAERLAELGHETELVVVKTEGDADQERPFAEVGALGLFVRAIERALVEGRADVAVHSYKDLPSESPVELEVVAVPERADARDRLLVRAAAYAEGAAGLPLTDGARVGTAAARRRALLADLRPDVRVETLRGNVPTRVARLRAGAHDAIVLAAAGLDRLAAAGAEPDLTGVVVLDLDAEAFVPAPAQGALALQARRDDPAGEAARALDDAALRRAVAAERALLALVQAGCDVPFGAHAREVGAGRAGERELELLAALGDPAGRAPLRRARVHGRDPLALAQAAYAELRRDR